MSRLLEKLPLFRRRRLPSPSSRTPGDRHSTGRDRRWLWGGIGGVAIVLAFYFWFTSARLLTEPIRVEYGPVDPSFTNAMGAITGAEFTSGNRLENLVNGDAFFPRMLRAIQEAKSTITLETYIWSSGYISNLFIEALSERARAGVKVHIIFDGMGSLKFKETDRDRLGAAGVQLYRYGRAHWWEIKPHFNHRTHRKLLIVDGKVGFIGGMCIDDGWLGNAHAQNLWRETELRVEGPAVRQMQAVFAHNWLQTTSSLLVGEEYFPKLDPVGSSVAQCYKSGPGEGAQVTRLAYLFAIASARKTIDIANAYFVPDDLAVTMLLQAMARGVKVRVVAPAFNDSKFGRAASRSRWGKLLAAGAEFHLYQPAMYHAKTMIVDDVLYTIGSSNFDNRSFSINDEDGMVVLDAKLAAESARIFADDMKNSKQLTREQFESRPFYIKIIDNFCGLFRSQL